MKLLTFQIFAIVLLQVYLVPSGATADSAQGLHEEPQPPDVKPVADDTTTTSSTTTTSTTVKPTTPTPPPPPPPTNATTTTIAPPTNATTTTVAPPTNATTTTQVPPTNGTTTNTPITTPKPTSPPAPKPEPDRKFDGPSFIGGMILTLGLMAIGFVSWKFYKARTERNYHTL